MSFPLQLYPLKQALYKITAKVTSNFALKFSKMRTFHR